MCSSPLVFGRHTHVHTPSYTHTQGVVAKLVRLKDPATATALEVAAAGKLYQVVVDSERTAKALLSNGQLKQRVTIIPLNKVSSKGPSASATSAAARLAPGKATLALELVGYQPEMAAAIKYAFRNAFVCQDAATAKQLAYSRQVATRCITLEGDDFNPSGLLTGGSRNRGAPLLARVARLAEIEAVMEGHAARIAEIQRALGDMAQAGKQHAALQRELELATHALQLLQARVAGSERAQLQEAVRALEGSLAEAQSAAEAARAKRGALVDEAAALEREAKDFKKDAAKHVKATQGALAAAKKALEGAKREAKAAESQWRQQTAEAESSEQERVAVAGQVATQTQLLAGC